MKRTEVTRRVVAGAWLIVGLCVIWYACMHASRAHAQSALPSLPAAGVAIVYFGDPPAQSVQIEAYVQALIADGYFAPLQASEGLGMVVYLGTSTVPAQTYVDEGGPVSNANEAIGKAVSDGLVPPPSGVWGTTVYLALPSGPMSLTPPGYPAGYASAGLEPWTAGQDVCGFHSDIGGTIVDAVAPVDSPCADKMPAMAAWERAISHELTEALTRPYRETDPGLYTNWPEPADVCEDQGIASYGPWAAVSLYATPDGHCTSGAYVEASG